MTEGTSRSRKRSVLVAILGVLACVAITLSATTLWVHQVALNTDRYVTVVSRVATNAEVVEEVSGRLADQVVQQFDIPQLVKPLLRNWIQEQIATFMGTDVFLEAWARANRVAHTTLIRILRSDSPLASSDEPVTISMLPVIVVGLERLQEVGLIPDDLELPDPSDSEALAAIRDAVAERLNIDLPPDFGEITLVRPARLEAARQFVKIFDLITVASIVLAVGLVALTIWLARDRRRAVIFLGLGAAIAVLLAEVATLGIGRAAANYLAAEGSSKTVTALLDAMLGNLATALTIVLIIGVVAAVAAVVVGRRAEPPMELAPVVPTSPKPAPPPAEPVPPPAKPATRALAKPAAKKTPATPAAKTPAKRTPTKST